MSKLGDGKWVSKVAYAFHMACKNQIRELFNGNPTKADLSVLDGFEFDESLATCEAGDGGFNKGEEFVTAMINNYLQVYDAYFEPYVKIVSPTDPNSFTVVNKITGEVVTNDPYSYERKLVPKMTKYTLAIFRNDSAYYERLGGILQLICQGHEVHIKMNKAQFKASGFTLNKVKFINAKNDMQFYYVIDDRTNYEFVIYTTDKFDDENPLTLTFVHNNTIVTTLTPKEIYNIATEIMSTPNTMDDNVVDNLHYIEEWWDLCDKRARTKPWLRWIFSYMINKYNSDLFYRRSMNFVFTFILQNTHHWTEDPIFEACNWFPKKRGKLANMLFGGGF